MNCEICGSNDWRVAHEGFIRDGAYPNQMIGVVYECRGCGVQRLDEELCIPEQDYLTDAYRMKVDGAASRADYIAKHDAEQRIHLRACHELGVDFRDKSVLDVGCGAGLFLDHVAGIAKSTKGVEPNETLRRDAEHAIYSDFGLINRHDVVVSFNVIEHVQNPVEFLKQIKNVTMEGGDIIICTPNRYTALMEWLPEYRSWFYRNQHRWYFEASVLDTAAMKAGLYYQCSTTIQTYDLANALLWMRDRKPPMPDAKLYGVSHYMNEEWKRDQEMNWRGTYCYALLRNYA